MQAAAYNGARTVIDFIVVTKSADEVPMDDETKI